MHKIKAFTLAEALITLVIIAVIALLMMNCFDVNHTRQRELLGRFQMVFVKLENLVSMSAQTSKNHSNWNADVNSLANLSCTDESGNNVENKSECLKKAFMTISSQLKDCPSPNECFADYTKLTEQLKSIFPSLDVTKLNAFTIPGGVNVLAAYLDGECELEIPINKDADNNVEKVKGCGFLLADANGKSKPNNLLVDEARTIDRFLMVITPNGLVKSNLLEEIAGCPKGTRYDADTKSCEEEFNCPVDMGYMHNVQSANKDNLIVIQYSYGAKHGDCYEVSCKSGDKPDSNYKCPEPCSASDEKRLGGLWLSEGGYLPEGQEKACCVPVSNQEELAAINTDENSRSRTYCLTSDITFDKNGAGSDSTKGWIPNSFTGTFYGNGHKINGLYINDTQLYCAGLFKTLGGTVRDIIMEGGNITGGQIAGGLIGCNTSGHNVINAINTGSVTASYENDYPYSGGVIGKNNGSSINVINTGRVTVSYSGSADSSSLPASGGVSGRNEGEGSVTNAINAGTVTASSESRQAYSGGVSGINGGSVTNAINIGSVTVSALTYSGGLIGENEGSVANAINTGNVTASSTSTYVYSGGVNGWGYGSITNVINAGSVTASSTSNSVSVNSGGVSGGNYGSITNAINAGSVTATSNRRNYAGGVVGSNDSGLLYSSLSLVNASINIGNISSTFPFGGIFGSGHDDEISNSFYLSGTVRGCIGGADVEGCSGKTEAELKQAATYSAFDTTVWSIVGGYYPTIRASIMPPQIFRDCRNDQTPYGGCYDVLNTPNALIPDFGTTSPIGVEGNKPYIMWAWKEPATATSTIEPPVLRFQCKPYRADGYDCCRPSYATWEPKLKVCPALVAPTGANYRAVN